MRRLSSGGMYSSMGRVASLARRLGLAALKREAPKGKTGRFAKSIKARQKASINAPAEKRGRAVEDRDGMRLAMASAARCIGSSCFVLHETGELTLRCEEEGRSDKKTSHAGIIRIGFEGISQPHTVEHPCFSNSIETFPAGFCNWRNRRGTSSINVSPVASRPAQRWLDSETLPVVR